MPEIEEHLQYLYDLIESQKSQLLLACTVLVALGFDVSEAFGIL